jgi:hypothetical protein
LTESKTVLCAKCGTEHQTRPEAREGFDKDGTPVFGVFAKDYTYHMDFFNGSSQYVPLCNTHDRDTISLIHTKDLYIGS